MTYELAQGRVARFNMLYQHAEWTIPLKEAASLVRNFLPLILCDPNFAVSLCFEPKNRKIACSRF